MVRDSFKTKKVDYEDAFFLMLRVVHHKFATGCKIVNIENDGDFDAIPEHIKRIDGNFSSQDPIDLFMFVSEKKISMNIHKMFSYRCFQFDVTGNKYGTTSTQRIICDPTTIRIHATDEIKFDHFFKQIVSMRNENEQTSEYAFPVANPALLCIEIADPKKNMKITEYIHASYVNDQTQDDDDTDVNYQLHSVIFREPENTNVPGHYVACVIHENQWICHVSRLLPAFSPPLYTMCLHIF